MGTTRRDLSRLQPAVHNLFRVVDPIVAPVVRRIDASQEPSDIPVTLLIPVHPKDFDLAARCIEHARNNVLHPIAEVIVVSSATPELEAFLQETGARFVDEADVLPLPPDELRDRLAALGYRRWQWILQQLLKLNADTYVETEHLLIIDADTLLLRPRAFKRGKTLCQEFSHERNENYLISYHRLLPFPDAHRFSFVCHHMFAERPILQALREEIEKATGRLWYEAIIELADSASWTEEQRAHPFNFFSEYETYGLFCRRFYDQVENSYFLNYGARDFRPGEDHLETYLADLPSFCRWASFHSYYYNEDEDLPL